MHLYNSQEENNLLKIIAKRYPDCEIINPANYSSKDMAFYYGLVNDSDKLTFYGDTIGVVSEVIYAMFKGLPCYDADSGKLINIYQLQKFMFRLGVNPYFYNDIEKMRRAWLDSIKGENGLNENTKGKTNRY